MSAKPSFVFGKDFQDNMLSLMVSDLTFADKAIKYIDPDYLFSDLHKWVFFEVKKKFEQEGTVPSLLEIEDNLKTMQKAKRSLYRKFAIKIFNSSPIDPEFVRDKLTDFAKRVAFTDLFLNAQTLYNSGEAEGAYLFAMEAINRLHSISFRDDLVVSVAEFEALRQRYVAEGLLSSRHIPTGIVELDRVLNGGLEKGRLAVLMAAAKTGKSFGLIHMGCAALMMRTGQIAHIVLEGSTEETIMRYQARLTGVKYERLDKDDLTDEERDLLSTVGKKYLNRLQLIPFNKDWEYTVGDVETKLQELDRKGLTPDLICLDYADLLNPRKKNKEHRFDQRDVFRDLKRIALMRKVAIWTASQSKRPSGKETERTLLRSSDISEAYEKVRIADFVGTLNQTMGEKEQGIMRLHCDIYRSNQSDVTIRLITDFNRAIFHRSKWSTIDRQHTRSVPWLKGGD